MSPSRVAGGQFFKGKVDMGIAGIWAQPGLCPAPAGLASGPHGLGPGPGLAPGGFLDLRFSAQVENPPGGLGRPAFFRLGRESARGLGRPAFFRLGRESAGGLGRPTFLRLGRESAGGLGRPTFFRPGGLGRPTFFRLGRESAGLGHPGREPAGLVGRPEWEPAVHGAPAQARPQTFQGREKFGWARIFPTDFFLRRSGNAVAGRNPPDPFPALRFSTYVNSPGSRFCRFGVEFARVGQIWES